MLSRLNAFNPMSVNELLNPLEEIALACVRNTPRTRTSVALTPILETRLEAS
ncbi:hypothetical protein JG687_00010452 [Phytophthora cactorum]|uniref:Uncharacterized protein n=1 Tax=Phytophthora cactorum TaxID=29920 RepID=A0A8T1UCA5_9STRA|nr:hypothetical protein JG687_00010452 [Phytophthora cactorum]